MVWAIDYEYLRDALLVELVSLDDFIGSDGPEPVLVSIAESDRKWQSFIAETIRFRQTMLREATELECRGYSLFRITVT